MIEIIYSDTNEKENRVLIRPPKNIRQLGIPDLKKKVYVEDYVYTYLHQSGKKTRNATVAVLLGKSEQSQGVQYCFVSGAISCDGIMMDSEKIIFTEQAFVTIYEKIKEFFEGQEIVGWFFSKAGMLMEITPNIQSAHLNYFAGVDKVFWMYEPERQSEKLFLYDYGQLRELSGFYIYYEKNPQMQEYMVKNFQKERPIEMKLSEDEAIRNYRQLMQEKEHIRSKKEHKKVGALGILTTLTFIALAIVGINMLNSYEKMQEMETVLSQISKTVESVSADLSEEDSERVTVETIRGTVTKEEQDTGTDTSTENQSDTSDQDTTSTDTTQNDTTQDGASTGTAQSETLQSGTSQSSTAQSGTAQNSTVLASAAAENVATVQSQNTSQQEYYVVQEGDSLEVICQKLYNTCNVLDELCELNGIDNKDTIYVGQKLKLI